MDDKTINALAGGEPDPHITPVASHGHTLNEYNPEALPEHLRWKGPGEPPAYWWADGTKVYRSYADYCDD